MDQNHLFWVLSSQSYKSPLRVTSYKSDGLYLWIGIALARCEAASRGAKLTEVSLTMAEKGGDLTGALHYIPVLSWGSWKTLRLNGDKKDVHCLVFYGFQNAPINVVPYTCHLETAQYVFLHSSLFFSFCCSPLRTFSLTITSP